MRRKAIFTASFLLSVVFALAGQYQFSYSRDLETGSILYLVSIMLFYVSHRFHQKEKTFYHDYTDKNLIESSISIRLDFKSRQFWFLLLSFVMFAYVVFETYREMASTFSLFVWTASLVLFTISFQYCPVKIGSIANQGLWLYSKCNEYN